MEKGLPREEAYKIVQTNAARSWDEGRDFRDLLRSDSTVASYLTPQELEELFDYGYYTRYVDDTFRRLGLLPAVAGVTRMPEPASAD